MHPGAVAMNARRKIFAIALDILQWEINHQHDGQLLSQECDRFIDRHPVLGRPLIIGVGLILTAHLANITPPRYDPVGGTFWAGGVMPQLRRAFRCLHPQKHINPGCRRG